jgi:hypothetical protein
MNNQNKDKRVYAAPLIDRILLDNEISLILESDPPFGPDESISFAVEYFNNNPFKSNVG